MSSGGEEMEVLQQQQGRKAPARGGARGGRGARGGKKAAGVVTIPDDSDEDDFGSTRYRNWHHEPVFLNVYGAQESIPRNEFRQPKLAGRYDYPIPLRILGPIDSL